MNSGKLSDALYEDWKDKAKELAAHEMKLVNVRIEWEKLNSLVSRARSACDTAKSEYINHMERLMG